MSSICDYCKHQDKNRSDGVWCDKAGSSYNEGYGPFKNNCVCIYDPDLKNHFEAATKENDINKQNLASQVERLRTENHRLQYEKSVLETRLTKIIEN